MPKAKMVSKSNRTKSEKKAWALIAPSTRAIKHNDAKTRKHYPTARHGKAHLHISEEQNEPI